MCIRDRCEYQNDPPDENDNIDDVLDSKGFLKRISKTPRGKLPVGTEHLTAFVDVQGQLLYWAVVAFGKGFRLGMVVDYGTFPEQPTRYFTLNSATKKLAAKYRGAKLGDRINSALKDLIDEDLMPRDWQFDDSKQTMKIGRLLVDANWGDSSNTVYGFCKSSKFSRHVMPAHGKYIGPTAAPISKYKSKKGEKVGCEWITRRNNSREVKHITFDSNWFKTQMHAAFAVEPGNENGMMICSGSAAAHQMLIDQLLSEKPSTLTKGERTTTLWTLPQSKPDNHLLDCVSGAIVAASLDGCKFPFENKRKRGKSAKKRFAI